MFFNIFFTDPAKILSITSSAAKSWIGQTMTLKCVSDGVPTPTLTWYRPDGNELNRTTAKESTVEVSFNHEKDFGDYKCATYNGLDPLNDFSMTLEQIRRCPYIFQKYVKIIVKRDDLEKSGLSSYKKASSVYQLSIPSLCTELPKAITFSSSFKNRMFIGDIPVH